MYVDSPLSTNATEVFRLHSEYHDADTYQFMLTYRDFFGSSRLRYIRHVEESKALNGRRDPMIIISASGMCEHGRIPHHLKNNIEDPRNTVLFVSFQAEHTLGRRIRDGAKEVPILGERFQVRARVEAIDGYSAHADHDELLDYVGGLRPEKIRAAFVVHGEPEAAQAVKHGLLERGVPKVVTPERGTSVRL